MTTRQTITYRHIDGLDIKADIYLPEAHGRVPVAVFLHGGALIWGSRREVYSHWFERLPAAGIAVAAIDYRLAPETKLPAIVSDIHAGLDWIYGEAPGRLPFDPARVAIIGASAGAYLGLLAACEDTRPRAVVSLYGYGDILAGWYLKPSPHYSQFSMVTREEALQAVGDIPLAEGDRERGLYYLYLRQQGRWVQGVSGMDPEADREELLRYCPLHNLRGDYPPTLLLHGDSDTDVPFEESEKLLRGLRDKGVPVRLIALKGRGHAFDSDIDAQDVKAVVEAVQEFLMEELDLFQEG